PDANKANTRYSTGTATTRVSPAAAPADTDLYQGHQVEMPSFRSRSKSAWPVGTNNAPRAPGPFVTCITIPPPSAPSDGRRPPSRHCLQTVPHEPLRELDDVAVHVLDGVGVPMIVRDGMVVIDGQERNGPIAGFGRQQAVGRKQPVLQRLDLSVVAPRNFP